MSDEVTHEEAAEAADAAFWVGDISRGPDERAELLQRYIAQQQAREQRDAAELAESREGCTRIAGALIVTTMGGRMANLPACVEQAVSDRDQLRAEVERLRAALRELAVVVYARDRDGNVAGIQCKLCNSHYRDERHASGCLLEPTAAKE